MLRIGITGNIAAGKTAVEKILKEKGAKKVAFADLTRDDFAESIEDAFRYDKLILAASSYNGDVFPPMEHFLNHLKSKNYQKRKIGIIENGTWAPSAGKAMKNIIDGMKEIDFCDNMVTIKSRMNEDSKKEMEKLADEILNK